MSGSGLGYSSEITCFKSSLGTYNSADFPVGASHMLYELHELKMI